MSLDRSRFQLPYAHLNLRRNPFGEFSEADRTNLAVVDVAAILQRLADPRYAVQFMGEKGYGKTTHLLVIRSHFAKSGYVHSPEGQRAAMPAGCPLLVDEAQRLTRWQQHRVFRSGTPLVLGTHRNFERELRRAGRDVETINADQGTDTETLHRLLNARIAWVRRHDGPVPVITLDAAARLHRKFGPNIRGMLHELYAMVQQMTEISAL